MKNAARTFMEAKDLVSRVKQARGYFPVVGVGAVDGFQVITPRGSRQIGAGKGTGTGMSTQAGKGRGRGYGPLEILDVQRQPNPDRPQRELRKEDRLIVFESMLTLSSDGTYGPGLSESRDA